MRHAKSKLVSRTVRASSEIRLVIISVLVLSSAFLINATADERDSDTNTGSQFAADGLQGLVTPPTPVLVLPPSSTPKRPAARPTDGGNPAKVAGNSMVRAEGPTRWVNSTAYCLTGTMANGQRVFNGAVAMNGVDFGTRWKVLTGPRAGSVLTVADRIGHSSQFDIAMPGNCAGARAYGRQYIKIARV